VKSPVIITSVVIIFLIPTLTTAELSITAGLKPRSEFNDNIFLSRSDNEGKESDLISHIGPDLGRPHVDTLNNSRHSNMKELRFKADNGVWRVAFAFDPERKAILLVAGDKSGVSNGFTRA
jgi:hypothetical protein